MPQLRFSDDELFTIETFAQPLPVADRGPFLERAAALLQGVEVGPGAIHRACEQAQLEARRSGAAIESRPHGGKYG